MFSYLNSLRAVFGRLYDYLYAPAAFGLRPRIDWASRDAFALRELSREGNRRVAQPMLCCARQSLTALLG